MKPQEAPINVLIGVDESPFSNAALQYVRRMPWPQGTRFRVISASPPVFFGPGEVAAPTAIAQLMEQQERHHRTVAEKAAQELRGAGLEVEGVMLSGDPRSVLIDEAKKAGADLIVLGSHGRTGITKLLLGSVASHVVSHAPCSVLLVRQPKP